MKRANSLDALRGFAILTMVLSGSIAFAGVLPAWMYHAQMPPPLHKFDPSIPGITWVDLVFPFFLFSMGAAFPFAMNKKLASGMNKLSLLPGILLRGFLLAGFAIAFQHFKPYAISSTPQSLEWFIGLAGFVLLFLFYLRFSKDSGSYKVYGIRLLSVILTLLLFYLLDFRGKPFSTGRSDIIILVLANVAVTGTIVWIFTRNNIYTRLGVLCLILGIRLTHGIEGSWTTFIWDSTFAAWLYKFYFSQYLFIVIPGTIAGDFLYKYYKSLQNEAESGEHKKIYSSVMILSYLLIVANLIGLFGRYLIANLIISFVFIATLLFLGKRIKNSGFGSLINRFLHWGAFWLILGLVFEPYEGGIKKDSPTLSYYFVTSGLAIFALTGLTILTDYLNKKKYVALLTANGQNPMIAYVAGALIVMPVFALTGINSLMNELNANAYTGFLKGVIFTGIVALITMWFTKKKIFWRT